MAGEREGSIRCSEPCVLKLFKALEFTLYMTQAWRCLYQSESKGTKYKPMLLGEGRDLVFHLRDAHGRSLSWGLRPAWYKCHRNVGNSRLTQKTLCFIIIQIKSDSEGEANKGVFFLDYLSTLITGHGVKM